VVLQAVLRAAEVQAAEVRAVQQAAEVRAPAQPRSAPLAWARALLPDAVKRYPPAPLDRSMDRNHPLHPRTARS